MSYEFSWEPRGLVIRFFGQITAQDILKASVDYEKDSRFDDLLYVIADYLQITSCNSEPEQIEDVLVVDSGARRSNSRIKRAIVTTHPNVIAMAKYYNNAFDPAFQVMLFATETEARMWIATLNESV